jgi:hypothetical protein
VSEAKKIRARMRSNYIRHTHTLMHAYLLQQESFRGSGRHGCLADKRGVEHFLWQIALDQEDDHAWTEAE